MAHPIDQEEAKAIIAEQRSASDPYAKENGIKGVIARSIDIHEVMTLWRVSETNRKSDPNDVMTALVNVFVNAVGAEIAVNSPPENVEDAISKITVESQHRLKRAVLIMSTAPTLEAKEVGTA